ncbi:MAG TPA: hypothetical protein VKU90_07535 [Caulobacteraceae bacterium]|nr:hypothetical protein [Caulobacteraceae bacterium]
MARNGESGIGARARSALFVGACAAVFVALAACAIYAVVSLAV